jgi:hypothetical protein
MIKPISLGLTERQNALLQRARMKLDADQVERVARSFDTSLLRRARSIVERVKQQKQLRYAADNAARRALLLIGDVYDRLVEACDDEIDQSRWRERQQRVERELSRIIRGQRP